MRIFYIAGREVEYSRTRIVLKTLQDLGHEVEGCFPPDRAFRHYPALLLKTLFNAPKADIVVVGFYGQILLPLVRLLTWKPIFFDMYITTLDTMVYDRTKAKPKSLKAFLYGLSDWLSYQLSSLVLLETQTHIKWFKKTFKTSGKKLRHLYLAVDEKKIYPRTLKKETEKFLVHFHGEYAPFHGVPHILRAADLLKNENVQFQIVGRGIEYDECQILANELLLENVKFYDTVPYEELANMMAKADVCLGIFGGNQRMIRILSNKVVESMAMRKPLISGRNSAVQELLTDHESAMLVERANPAAIAEAIIELVDKPELLKSMQNKAFDSYQKNCSLAVFAKGFESMLKELVQDE